MNIGPVSLVVWQFRVAFEALDEGSHFTGSDSCFESVFGLQDS